MVYRTALCLQFQLVRLISYCRYQPLPPVVIGHRYEVKVRRWDERKNMEERCNQKRRNIRGKRETLKSLKQAATFGAGKLSQCGNAKNFNCCTQSFLLNAKMQINSCRQIYYIPVQGQLRIHLESFQIPQICPFVEWLTKVD